MAVKNVCGCVALRGVHEVALSEPLRFFSSLIDCWFVYLLVNFDMYYLLFFIWNLQLEIESWSIKNWIHWTSRFVDCVVQLFVSASCCWWCWEEIPFPLFQDVCVCVRRGFQWNLYKEWGSLSLCTWSGRPACPGLWQSWYQKRRWRGSWTGIKDILYSCSGDLFWRPSMGRYLDENTWMSIINCYKV